MSRAIQHQRGRRHPYEQWGPDHQHMRAPWHPEEKRRHPVWRLIGWFLAAMYLHTLIDNGGRDEIGWCINVLILGWIAKKLIQGVRNGTIPVHWIALARRVVFETASRTAVVFARVAPRVLPERMCADAESALGGSRRACCDERLVRGGRENRRVCVDRTFRRIWKPASSLPVSLPRSMPTFRRLGC